MNNLVSITCTIFFPILGSGTQEDSEVLREKLGKLATLPSFDSNQKDTRATQHSAKTSASFTIDLKAISNSAIMQPSVSVKRLDLIESIDTASINVNELGSRSLPNNKSVTVALSPVGHLQPSVENGTPLSKFVKVEKTVGDDVITYPPVPKAFSMDSTVDNVLSDSGDVIAPTPAPKAFTMDSVVDNVLSGDVFAPPAAPKVFSMDSIIDNVLSNSGDNILQMQNNPSLNITTTGTGMQQGNFHQRFACTVCRRRFSHPSYLKRHTCLKDRTCTICVALFDSVSRLRAHSLSVHGVDVTKPSVATEAAIPSKKRKKA